MKAVLKRSLSLILLIGGVRGTVCSQINTSTLEVGVTAGSYVYQGDLTPHPLGSFKASSFGVSLFANKILNRSLSVRTSLTFASVKGDDADYTHPAYRPERALAFRSPVVELSGLVVWDVLGKNGPGHSGFSPYLFGGIGFTFLHPRRNWSRFNGEYFGSEPATITGLAADIDHPVPKGLPVFPVGAGLKYAVSQHISVLAETSYRYTRTDYLDGFSQVANPSKKDSYNSYSLGLVYRFGSRNTLACPVVRN